MSERKGAKGRSRVISTVRSSRARTPPISEAWPLRNAFAPTIFSNTHGRFPFAARSKENLTSADFSSRPGWNRPPPPPSGPEPPPAARRAGRGRAGPRSAGRAPGKPPRVRLEADAIETMKAARGQPEGAHVGPPNRPAGARGEGGPR